MLHASFGKRRDRQRGIDGGCRTGNERAVYDKQVIVAEDLSVLAADRVHDRTTNGMRRACKVRRRNDGYAVGFIDLIDGVLDGLRILLVIFRVSGPEQISRLSLGIVGQIALRFGNAVTQKRRESLRYEGQRLKRLGS